MKKMDNLQFLIGLICLCLAFQLEAKNVPSKTTNKKSWSKPQPFPQMPLATKPTSEAQDSVLFNPRSSVAKEQQSWIQLLEQIPVPTDHPLYDAILSRIIDGEVAPPGRWPWNVVLDTHEYGFVCAGTLIAKQWVLTAAHCDLHNAPVTIYAKIGAWNRTANDQKDTIPVEEFFVHPDFDRRERKNDISLLKLSREATVTDADILALPDPAFNFFEANPFCFITGWGVSEQGSTQTSPVLRERWVNVISSTECQSRWGVLLFPPEIYSSNICIDEGLSGTISACQGDSGSPLQCFDVETMTWKMAGFTSWGSNACTMYPSVYTRTQNFLHWIQTIIAHN